MPFSCCPIDTALVSLSPHLSCALSWRHLLRKCWIRRYAVPRCFRDNFRIFSLFFVQFKLTFRRLTLLIYNLFEYRLNLGNPAFENSSFFIMSELSQEEVSYVDTMNFLCLGQNRFENDLLFVDWGQCCRINCALYLFTSHFRIEITLLGFCYVSVLALSEFPLRWQNVVCSCALILVVCFLFLISR